MIKTRFCSCGSINSIFAVSGSVSTSKTTHKHLKFNKFGYFSITYICLSLRTTFSDLNQQKHAESDNLKYQRKFEDIQEKPEFWLLT